MANLKERKLELLAKVCKENDLPIKMVHTLLQDAEKFSYENASEGARKKKYTDLIDFYIKKQ